MPTHRNRDADELSRVRPIAPRSAHTPLTGRDGAPLGVEPVRRTSQPDAADSGVARRARLLARNDWRSVPPPGA